MACAKAIQAPLSCAAASRSSGHAAPLGAGYTPGHEEARHVRAPWSPAVTAARRRLGHGRDGNLPPSKVSGPGTGVDVSMLRGGGTRRGRADGRAARRPPTQLRHSRTNLRLSATWARQGVSAYARRAQRHFLLGVRHSRIAADSAGRWRKMVRFHAPTLLRVGLGAPRTVASTAVELLARHTLRTGLPTYATRAPTPLRPSSPGATTNVVPAGANTTDRTGIGLSPPSNLLHLGTLMPSLSQPGLPAYFSCRLPMPPSAPSPPPFRWTRWFAHVPVRRAPSHFQYQAFAFTRTLPLIAFDYCARMPAVALRSSLAVLGRPPPPPPPPPFRLGTGTRWFAQRSVHQSTFPLPITHTLPARARSLASPSWTTRLCRLPWPCARPPAVGRRPRPPAPPLTVSG